MITESAKEPVLRLIGRAAYLPVRSLKMSDQRLKSEILMMPVVITALSLNALVKSPLRRCWVARVPPQPGQSIPVWLLIGQEI